MTQLLIITCVLFIASPLLAQPKASAADSLASALSAKYLDQVNNKLTALNRNVEKKTLAMLRHLEKQEKSIQKKLAAKDSLAAQQLFTVKDRYQSLQQLVKKPLTSTGLQEYIPELDSLATGLDFLKQSAMLTSKLPKEWNDKLKSAQANVHGFENKFQQATDIAKMIKERRQQLKEQLAKAGLTKELKKINKEIFYYQQQLSQYKSILKDRKKLEQKAMAQLRKVPAFTAFMKKNSQLASLFRLPGDDQTAESLAGLQTRASIQNQLQARFASTGANPQQYIGQQVLAAKAELSKIKDKLNKHGGGSSDIEMPDFKPNTQKTKSFLNRIEYGANVQSQKANALLPVTSDLALTAGYKLNDKGVIGIGASYKLGWGSGWKNIKLTHEGIGLRSYIDWKLAPVFGRIEGFWITGGYEQNFQDLTLTSSEGEVRVRSWQASGLIGLSKKYKIGKKTNNLQLLWDFLSYRQVPQRQAVLFRVGYVF